MQQSTSIKLLKLNDFRSYTDLKLEVDERPIVLTGPNGAGKTNILEAISFLAPGQGIRRAKLTDITRHTALDSAPETHWSVFAEIAQGEDEYRLGTSIERLASGAIRRRAKIDSDQASPNDLGHYVRLVWLTPIMDRLFLEGPGNRRRFLDRLLLAHDPDHASRVAKFEKALRDRQKVLREFGRNEAWLSALEQVIAETGIAIAAARSEMVARLNGAMEKGAETPFPRPAMAIDGELETRLMRESALDTEQFYLTSLEARRTRDAEAGRATLGPHCSDIDVLYPDKNMPAKLCSTGEQKALLVSIILASAKLILTRSPGATPIILLDEIVAHMDASRRAALFDEIGGFGCQTWMTGTDAGLFSAWGNRAQFFEVSGGDVVRS